VLTVVGRAAGPNREKPLEFVRGPGARLPWAWDGLCFAVPIHESSVDGLRDVVNNVLPSLITGVAPTRDGRGNLAMDWAAVNQNRIEYPSHPEHSSPSTAITVYVRMKAKNVATASGPPGDLIEYTWSSNTDPWRSWGMLTPTTDITKTQGWITTGGAGGYTFLGPCGPMPTTEYSSMFLRWRSGEAPRLDILGERGNTLFTFIHSSTLTGNISYAAGGRIFINAGVTTFNQIDGIYSQAMVWSRRLSDVEMTALVADPFGWYAPKRETITVAAPFPIGPGAAGPGLLFVGPVR
jgi:hypothetical protein